MPKIFISYRRDDTPYAAVLLKKALVHKYGKNSVFFDIESIPYGADFQQHIDNAIAGCDVLLALIGDSWIACRNKDGVRRLDDPRDVLRVEIETALTRGIPVLPVLTGNAKMPDEKELPETIREIARRHAPEVRAGSNFGGHMKKLLSAVHQLLQLSDSIQDNHLYSNPVASQPAKPQGEVNERRSKSPREPHPQPMSRYSLLGESLILHCISEQRVVVGRDWESVDVLLLPFSSGGSPEINVPLFERISRRLLEFAWEESGLIIHDLRAPERRTAMPALWGNSPFGGSQRLRDGSVADKNYEYLLSGVMSLQIVPQQVDARLAAVWLTLKWLCDDAWNSNQWLLLRPGYSLPVSLTDGVPTLLLTTDGVWMPADGTATDDGNLNCEQRAKPVTVGQRIGSGNQSVTLSEFSTH